MKRKKLSVDELFATKGLKAAWEDFARNYMEKCRNATPMPPFRLYYTKEQIEALAKSLPNEMVKRGRKWYLNGVEVVQIGLLKVPGKRKAVRK